MNSNPRDIALQIASEVCRRRADLEDEELHWISTKAFLLRFELPVNIHPSRLIIHHQRGDMPLAVSHIGLAGHGSDPADVVHQTASADDQSFAIRLPNAAGRSRRDQRPAIIGPESDQRGSTGGSKIQFLRVFSVDHMSSAIRFGLGNVLLRQLTGGHKGRAIGWRFRLF